MNSAMPSATAYRHAHACAAPFEYPSTARAGWHAACQWFNSDTTLPAARFRDNQFKRYCAAQDFSPEEHEARRDTFHQAFAAGVGSIVVEEGRFRAASS